MNATDTTLTLSLLRAYARIVDVCSRTGRVAWLLEPSGRTIYGTARSVGDEQGYFIGAQDDIRTAYVRITTDTGLERFEPIAELVAQLDHSFFVLGEGERY